MNTGEEIFSSEGSAPFWQDKNASPRVPVASGEPSPTGQTGLSVGKSPKQHSTKRRTVQAAGWIDAHFTDAYIQQRLCESKKTIDPKFTRSKVIAEMLKERAQDDTFQRNQQILVPIIQDVMHAEFRTFENRFLAVIAKIAYQVSFLLYLLMKYLGTRIDPQTLHQYEIECEKDARVHITERSPQMEDVKHRIWQAMEG